MTLDNEHRVGFDQHPVRTMDMANDVLVELLRTRRAVGPNGELMPLSSGISARLAMILQTAVCSAAPAVAIEVGMACGVSTLAILDGLEQLGEGRLISIDPFQDTRWNRTGRHSVERAGLAHRHTTVPEFDYVALPRLVAEGLSVDFAYVDGWHTFDYTLLDLFYVDKMLTVGGVLGVNDCAMPAVDRAVDWLLSHRRYEEIDIPMPPTERDRYLVKRESWEPPWDFNAPF